MRRYKIEYANNFEDGDEVASEACREWVETIEEARDRAAVLSEQFLRADVFDTTLPRGTPATEVWEDGRCRSGSGRGTQ